MLVLTRCSHQTAVFPPSCSGLLGTYWYVTALGIGLPVSWCCSFKGDEVNTKTFPMAWLRNCQMNACYDVTGNSSRVAVSVAGATETFSSPPCMLATIRCWRWWIVIVDGGCSESELPLLRALTQGRLNKSHFVLLHWIVSGLRSMFPWSVMALPHILPLPFNSHRDYREVVVYLLCVHRNRTMEFLLATDLRGIKHHNTKINT